MIAPAPVIHIDVGDVLVMTGTSAADKLIEIGEVAAGLPASSHVAGAHHRDANGTWWGIEGRPGGVGWVQLTRYLADPRTVTNAAQPKTATQRAAVAKIMKAMLGTAYDWQGGILGDAERDLLGEQAWAPDPVTGLVPAHVVCSSAWAYGYDRCGLAAPRPADWRHVEPGDWSLFIEQQGWGHPATP